MILLIIHVKINRLLLLKMEFDAAYNHQASSRLHSFLEPVMEKGDALTAPYYPAPFSSNLVFLCLYFVISGHVSFLTVMSYLITLHINLMVILETISR